MFDVQPLLKLIPALPLLAAVLIAVLGPRLLRNQTHWIAIAAIGGSFVCSALLAARVTKNISQQVNSPSAVETVGYEETVTLWRWAQIDDALSLTDPEIVGSRSRRDWTVDITLRVDSLTTIMLVMVTFISTLIAIYSAGYMRGDRGYWRFFSYISLFVFSMTMLVLVSNFVLLFVFWEAVGVCSYLLIGFWYPKPEAAAAGMKAFLVNRVGDFGFTLGILLIWVSYGTLNFHDTANVAGVLGQMRLSGELGFVGGATGLAICLLLMVGACGKSAQFPLHVWLPDAMEGPTPVSALIHAATMVTAGVYMVTRCTPLFMVSATAQLIVACIGGITAVMAGIIAMTQFDLKRVLAYSTVSQLGYMFLALGTGSWAGIWAGMFHLFTHAFFKALLFLGAGSVMHAMGNTCDMRRFGGLRRLMPVTHWTFLFGCLALAGIIPFSGFYSKDNILSAVSLRAQEMQQLAVQHVPTTSGGSADHVVAAGEHAVQATSLPVGWTRENAALAAGIYRALFYLAIFTAFLTAWYTFRAFFMTFYGRQQVPPEAGDHAHESPASMWVPLSILSAFALGVGFTTVHGFELFLAHTPSLAYHPELAAAVGAHGVAAEATHHLVAFVSTLVALTGVAIAAYLYLGPDREVGALVYWLDGRWLEKTVDLGWTARLASLPPVALVSKLADAVRLGWLARLIGYLALALLCVLLSPLLLVYYLSPYKLSRDKFYVDEIYDVFVVRPLRGLSWLSYAFDRWVIDGFVNLVGHLPKWFGATLRGLQMGLVPFYSLAMVLGTVILLVLLVAPILLSGNW